MNAIIYLIIGFFKVVQKIFSILSRHIFKKSKRTKTNQNFRTYSTHYTHARPSNIIPPPPVRLNSSHLDSLKDAESTYLVKESNKTTLHVSINPSITRLRTNQTCFNSDMYDKKKRQREFRFKKMMERKCQWAIIRTFIIYDTLLNSGNIYEIKKAWKSLSMVQESLFDHAGKFIARQKDIKISIRLMKIKIANGECNGDSSKLSVNYFSQLQHLDLTPSLIKAYNNLENEWDEYYNRIKSDGKRIERLEYYIETLDKDLIDHNIKKYPDVALSIKRLRNKYTDLIKSLQSPTQI